MCKKILYVISLIVVLGLTGVASAQLTEIWWDNESGDMLWNNPVNWDRDGQDGQPSELNFVGHKLDGLQNVLIAGPSVNATMDCMSLGDSEGADAYMYFLGATMHTVYHEGGRGNWLIGVLGDGHGHMYMDGGTLDTDTDFCVAYMGTGDLRIIAGTIRAQGAVAIGAMNAGHIDLYGGTIIGEGISPHSAAPGMPFLMNPYGVGSASMDVRGDGTLLARGDWVGLINGYVASGWIYAGEPGYTIDVSLVDIDGITYTQVTAVPEPATIALIGLGGLALIRKRR